MAAAVADYRPAEPVAGKRAKDDRTWVLELEPTPDILRLLAGQRENGQVLVAFGAETGSDGLDRKRAMLDAKGVDLVVVNDIGRADIGFDSDQNEVEIVARSGVRHVPKASKDHVAAAILDEVERLLARA